MGLLLGLFGLQLKQKNQKKGKEEEERQLGMFGPDFWDEIEKRKRKNRMWREKRREVG